jgi:DNA uptake protein ComE-like DNA-binding protein
MITLSSIVRSAKLLLLAAAFATSFTATADDKVSPPNDIAKVAPSNHLKRNDSAPANVPICTTVRRNLTNKTGMAPVDINVASREGLIKVPGISATAAQQIIGERSKSKFSSWDDVLQRADSMRCTDFTGSALRVGPTGFGRGVDPKSPGW